MFSTILYLNPEKVSGTPEKRTSKKTNQPGILVNPFSGLVYYFKKFILPSSLSATAVGVGGKSDGSDGQKVRPGDLSLYGEPKDLSPEEKEQQTKLEKEIGKIREEVWVWYDNVKGYREKVVEVVVTAKDHSAEASGEVDPSQAQRVEPGKSDFKRTCDVCGDKKRKK